MIGLVDAEIIQDPVIFIPNLEIMKLYSYYKAKGEYVKLLNSPSEVANFSELFLRQEKEKSWLEDEYWNHPNLHLGGLYFTGGKYKPFSNPEIEDAVPTYRVYNDYLKYRLNDVRRKRHTARIISAMNSGFVRIHNGREVQFNQARPGNELFIYDNDINIQQDLDILKELNVPKLKKILYVFPLRVRSREELELVIENNLFSGQSEDYSIQQLELDWYMSPEEFESFTKKYYDYFLSKPTHNICVPIIPRGIGRPYVTVSQEIRYAREAIRKCYTAASKGLTLHMVYDADPNDTLGYFFQSFDKYTAGHCLGNKSFRHWHKAMYPYGILKFSQIGDQYWRCLQEPIYKIKRERRLP